MGPDLHHRNPHQAQESPALFIVLRRHSYGPFAVLLDICLCTFLLDNGRSFCQCPIESAEHRHWTGVMLELTSLASVSRSVASPLLSTLQHAQPQQHGSEHSIETACNNISDALASLPAGELLLLECGWLAIKDISAQSQQISAPALLYEGCGCRRVA